MVRSTPTTTTPKLLLAAVASLPALASAGARDYAQLGQPCMQRYDANAQVYKDISSLWKRNDKCQPGLVSNSTAVSSNSNKFALTCFVAPNDTGMDPRSGTMDLEGTCLKASCVGISSNNVNTLEPSSERVTICHRTENELNPWVRMTVDKQAWIDSSNDCGFTTEDYIVKEHGSRANVEDQMNKGLITDFTTAQEYWEYWDRACPYVRQDPEHPHRCCQGPDCCGDAADTTSEQETSEQAPSEPEFERKLQDNSESQGCSSPSEDYSQDIYISFMGSTDGYDLAESLALLGTNVAALQDEFRNTYNSQGGFGQCVFFSRLVESVTIDTNAPVVPAMNKNYDLVGYRVKATVTGKCIGCQNHMFLPTDSCKDTIPSTCEACEIDDGAGGTIPGKVVQIAGKDLYPLLNANLGLEGTGAEIFRIQGDVDGETTCSASQQKYLEATGEVVCL